MPEHPDEPRSENPPREGRRSFLKKVGIGTAVAWTAPTIATTKAYAQGTCGITDPNDLVGLYAWYDGADPTTINIASPPPPTSDVAVATWDDKSGANRHLGQSSASLQPTWRFNTGINGLPSVEFLGGQLLDWLATDASLGALSSTTIFLVLANDIVPDGPVLWGSSTTTPAVTTAWQIGGPDAPGLLAGETFSFASNDLVAGTDNVDFVLGTNLITITQTAVPALTDMRADGAGITVSLGNNIQDLTPSAANGGTGLDTLRVGADDLATTTYFDGVIGEIIIYDYELSLDEILAVECYLTLKWFT
jgi:hypothetical protein